MLIGLVVGVALWAAVQLINDHARASYADADRLLGAEAAFWIRHKKGADVDVAEYIKLRRAGFTEVYPLIESTLVSADGDVIAIIATDLLALPLFSLEPSEQSSSKPLPAAQSQVSQSDDAAFTSGLFSGRQWYMHDVD